jgi:L-amino acid N-acyltransferase
MLIRDASLADVAAIAAIFNHAILTSTASYTMTPVDLANRQDWMQARVAAGYPVLVAEMAKEVVGYGSYGAFRSGAGYDGTVEHSVHVAAAARGQGLGRALLGALIVHAREAGRHVMVGAIDAENAVSLALHERAGFARAGQLPQVGAKFGQWRDLVFVQLLLNEAPTPPG